MRGERLLEVIAGEGARAQTHQLLELVAFQTDVLETCSGLVEFKTFDLCHISHGGAADNGGNYRTASRFAFSASFQ